MLSTFFSLTLAGDHTPKKKEEVFSNQLIHKSFAVSTQDVNILNSKRNLLTYSQGLDHYRREISWDSLGESPTNLYLQGLD